MRGGNRIFRKKYSEDQVIKFVTEYKQQNKVFWSPTLKKECLDYKKWYYSIVYKLDRPSANLFFFLLQPPHYSKYSGKQLTMEEYSYSETYKGWTGFKKYTKEEQEKRVWCKIADHSSSSTKESRMQNSKRMKEYYKSDAGILARNKKSKSMLAFYKTEKGRQHKKCSNLKQSSTMKEKIQKGLFTPTITNTWTHWDAKIIDKDKNVKRFRSSWEACFFYSNSHLKYESIRTTIETTGQIVICDFYDDVDRVMFEIKPRNRYNIEIDKIVALQKYCFNNNIKFIWINENNILEYIDIEDILNDEQNKEQFLKMLKCKTIKDVYERRCIKN